MALRNIKVNEQYITGVDEKPTESSHNLVESGGVYDYTKELFEEYENIEIPFTGYFLDASGNEATFWDGACSDYIPVKEGDEIVFNSASLTTTKLVGYDANKQNPAVLLGGILTANHWYITSSIKYIRVSGSASDNTKYLHILNNKTYQKITDKMDDVLGEKVDGFETDAVVGAYITVNGSIGRGTGIYKDFTVYNGTKITILSGVSHPNTTVIGKRINSTTYEPLVLGYQISALPYEYVCEENMVVGISFYYGGAIDIHFTTNYGKAACDEIDRLGGEFQDLSTELSIQDIGLGFLFNKISVIGDSMAVATMDGYPSTVGSAWLSFLAKRWDCNGKEFYAFGGSSCYTWLNNNSWGLGKLLRDETIYNCYFIAYGHNDLGAFTVGEASDDAAPVTVTEGVPSCPEGYSFCAYYKAIINQIRTKAPHAMIFLLSSYDNVIAGSANGAAVEDIAEWYYNNSDKLVHCLDTGGVPVSDMGIGGHYSTIGYAYIAKRLNEEANKVIYQYRADEEIKTFGVYNL